mmetsp:Transcript_27619/g.38045  ORF Transcript_27619/g.38045 Transcript_27619/m.38045 type:complete len:221 (+) Transcript_27619:182-844(+)
MTPLLLASSTKKEGFFAGKFSNVDEELSRSSPAGTFFLRRASSSKKEGLPATAGTTRGGLCFSFLAEAKSDAAKAAASAAVAAEAAAEAAKEAMAARSASLPLLLLPSSVALGRRVSRRLRSSLMAFPFSFMRDGLTVAATSAATPFAALPTTRPSEIVAEAPAPLSSFEFSSSASSSCCLARLPLMLRKDCTRLPASSLFTAFMRCIVRRYRNCWSSFE